MFLFEKKCVKRYGILLVFINIYNEAVCVLLKKLSYKNNLFTYIENICYKFVIVSVSRKGGYIFNLILILNSTICVYYLIIVKFVCGMFFNTLQRS